MQDLLTRLLAALLSTIPSSVWLIVPKAGKATGLTNKDQDQSNEGFLKDTINMLDFFIPRIDEILIDDDRVNGTISLVCEKLIAPTLRSKMFPDNLSVAFLHLLLELTEAAPTSKSWRKEIADALNDPRFFSIDVTLFSLGWAPILKRWTMLENKIPELIGRLAIPATGGLFSNSGPLVARGEADRKTQLTLRRIALLVLASDADACVPSLSTLEEKLTQLLTATTSTSPSTAIRADIYLLYRILLLRVPSSQLRFWTVIHQELRLGLLAFAYPESTDTFSRDAIWQLCKLLDSLVTMAPDEFQPYQWMYIDDSLDAVYHSSKKGPTSLLARISEEILSGEVTGPVAGPRPASIPVASKSRGGRMPFLAGHHLNGGSEASTIDTVIRRFMKQLSIWTYEQTYCMGKFDLQVCLDDVSHDLFPHSN